MAGDGRGPSVCFPPGRALPQLGRGAEHAKALSLGASPQDRRTPPGLPSVHRLRGD